MLTIFFFPDSDNQQTPPISIKLSPAPPLSTLPSSRTLPLLIPPRQNLIHNTHLQRLARTQKLIPLHQPLNLIQRMRLREMALENLIQDLADAQDLGSVDGNIGCLAAVPPRRLVNHDAAVGQAVTLAGLAAAEEQGAHRSGLSDADGRDFGFDICHRVVDGQSCGEIG